MYDVIIYLCRKRIQNATVLVSRDVAPPYTVVVVCNPIPSYDDPTLRVNTCMCDIIYMSKEDSNCNCLSL